jgi:TonB family protein
MFRPLHDRSVPFLTGLAITIGLLHAAFSWYAPEGPPLPRDPLDDDLSFQIVEEIPRTAVRRAAAPALPRPVASASPVVNFVPTPDLLPVDPSPRFTEPDAFPPPSGGPSAEGDEEDPFDLSGTVLSRADVNPVFPGGPEAFDRYLRERVRYPQAAIENGVSGQVTLGFVVDTAGRLTDVRVLEGVGWGIDEQLVRVLRESPRWTPGQAAGRNVAVRHRKKVVFTLRP